MSSITSIYGPAVEVCQLFEAVSQATGALYYRGRAGTCRVVLVQTGERTNDGTAIWTLKIQQVVRDPTGALAKATPRDLSIGRHRGLAARQAPAAATEPPQPIPA